MKLVRFIEVIIGVVFVLAACFKVVDMHEFTIQIRYYNVLTDLTLIRYVAVASILAETVLGVALIAGIRLKGLVYAAVLATLVGFTGLIIYSWIFHDLADCGCFGAVLPMGPASTTSKNVVMMIAMALAWRIAHRAGYPQREASGSQAGELAGSLGGLAALVAVGLCFVLADNTAFFHPEEWDPERAFAQFAIETEDGVRSLDHGEYFVVLLSSTCPECMDAVDPLNELADQPDAPPVVALMLGENDELDQFRMLTSPEFPLLSIDALMFFSLIGREPPRYYYVVDGREVAYLDTLEATAETLRDFLESAQAG